MQLRYSVVKSYLCSPVITIVNLCYLNNHFREKRSNKSSGTCVIWFIGHYPMSLFIALASISALKRINHAIRNIVADAKKTAVWRSVSVCARPFSSDGVVGARCYSSVISARTHCACDDKQDSLMFGVKHRNTRMKTFQVISSALHYIKQ